MHLFVYILIYDMMQQRSSSSSSDGLLCQAAAPAAVMGRSTGRLLCRAASRGPRPDSGSKDVLLNRAYQPAAPGAAPLGSRNSRLPSLGGRGAVSRRLRQCNDSAAEVNDACDGGRMRHRPTVRKVSVRIARAISNSNHAQNRSKSQR